MLPPRRAPGSGNVRGINIDCRGRGPLLHRSQRWPACVIAVGAIFLAASGPPASAATGPVAAYGFNEGTGTAVADSSTGGGNPGTAAGTSWAAVGRFGRALSFNGSSSSVTVADSASLRLTTGMTLEAWVNPAALGASTWRTAVFKQTAGGMAYALYANDGGGRPTGQVNVVGEQNAAGTAQLPLSTWTHLATTYDGATLRLYVNGAQVASKPQTGSIAASTGPLKIGGNAIWGEYFSGLIDEVRVYDRALAVTEIQADMTAPIGVTPDTTSPTVRITSPAAGASVTGTVSVAADATDDRGVTGVQFAVDGVALGAEDTTAPYSAPWDTSTSAAGGHSLTAVARDAAGNRTTSAPVAVTVPAPPPPRFVNDRVVVGLDEPTTMAFTPDGRMLIAERDGTVWVVPAGAGQVSPTPFLQIPNVVTDNERGLLGITLDPSFAQNGYVYAYYTHSSLRNRVGRFTATGNSAPAATELVIWQNTTDAGIWHQGGDLHFGPDGYLYVSVGDHLQSQTRPGADVLQRQDPAHVARRDGARGQPVLRRRRPEPRRDLGARAAQPVPLRDRPADRPRDHRRRRREHDRGGQRRRARRQLRLADVRGRVRRRPG